MGGADWSSGQLSSLYKTIRNNEGYDHLDAKMGMLQVEASQWVGVI